MSGGHDTVFLVTPNPDDAAAAVAFLTEYALACRPCADLHSVASAFNDGIGCVVLVEEALVEEELASFADALRGQPAWSDVPLIVLAGDVPAAAGAVGRLFPSSGNVTILERPVNPFTLASAAQVALRATRRQLEVRDLLEERERAVRARDEFLAMLAHELRNPLAPMRNAVELQKHMAQREPLLQKTTGVLERQVNHIVRMVDDLLDVARVEQGKLLLRVQLLDLNQAARTALETALPTVEGLGHRVEVHAGETLVVNGDSTRIEQIISNLLINAAKFMPQPGVITVTTGRRRDQAIVTVEDHGVGFDPAQREALFGLFVQGTQSLDRRQGGLGIGLTLSRRLAELHGGTIEAHSEGVGRGSRFTLVLPVSDRALGIEPASEAAPSGSPRRILLVDDNADILETTQTLLSLWGHDVTTALNGREALEAFSRGAPDIAFIDIGLPGMDGYELAANIRRLPGEREHHALLIAMTGYGQPTDRARALAAGFDAHLLKPVSADALIALIADAQASPDPAASYRA